MAPFGAKQFIHENEKDLTLQKETKLILGADLRGGNVNNPLGRYSAIYKQNRAERFQIVWKHENNDSAFQRADGNSWP